MGNFEFAFSFHCHGRPVCSRRTFSPFTSGPGNTINPNPLIGISAGRHRFSAAHGLWRHHAIHSGKPRQYKPQLRLSSMFRSWSDSSALFRNLAVGVIGSVALIFQFQGFAYGDAGSVNGGTPATYPCEDVARYYSGTEGLEGAALMKRLYSIVSNQRSLSYKMVWDALKILDAADVDNPEVSSEIIEIYSLKSVSKGLAGKPEGWNREHLWPRSYGLKDHPSLTDLHNIRPADVNVNSSRGNKYFGECTPGSNGCIQPANHEAAFDTETDRKSWTPPSQVRGDIARSLMHMAVRYGFDGSPHLVLSDSPNARNREMGLLSILLKWNELDPPSREEQLRNERICHLYQHNRNPFIDHPEYANIIWNHDTSRQSAQKPPSLNAWINEFHYNNKGKDENEFLEIVVAPSTDANKLEAFLYNGADGRVYKSLSLRDKGAFSVTTTSSSNDGLLYSFYTAFVPLQNGPADGIALVLSRTVEGEDRNEVILFISYGGTVTATDGPAVGAQSVDVKLVETGESSKLDSIGVTGDPRAGFRWVRFVGDATPGMANTGQNF